MNPKISWLVIFLQIRDGANTSNNQRGAGYFKFMYFGVTPLVTIMRITAIAFLLVLTGYIRAQETPTQRAQPIVEEGKRLYRSEMASWYGTDVFMEKYKEIENVGGYFSYPYRDSMRCIFFSRSDNPKIIGVVSFDSTYNVNTASINLEERSLTQIETDIYMVRKLALEQVNNDTIFKWYKNTSLNLIPLVNGDDKKVYILTGPKENGVVIFGNDYLLTFDKNNKLLHKRTLHKNIIWVNTSGQKGEETIEAMHSHLPETGEFMTATDICTLMLYSKFTNWQRHTVVSERYLNVWDCKANRLTVVPHSK